MTTRLTLNNAVIKYGDVTAVNDVSLCVSEGEMLFITGSNGSGKSTLIRGIAGLLPLTSGTITRTKRTSYVPQVEEADREFPASVREIVITGRQRTGKLFYSHHDYDSAKSSMKELGIISLANNEIKTLSGGQLRRVFLARAICGEPELLLLDEPCAGLDAESHEVLFSVIRRLLDYGCAVVMVTHDDSDIEGITHSRIITISNGRITDERNT